MTNPITWSQIETECGDYRAGFVATFRKYEGRDTDERDGSNRIVKVTVSSFAAHFGIDRTTFRRWMGEVPGGRARDVPRPAQAARSFARNLPPAEKAKLAAELIDDDDVADEPEVREAVERQNVRRASREAGSVRDRGGVDTPEPFRGDLDGEAVLIVQQIEAARSRVARLLDRAEADQRPALVDRIRPAVARLAELVDTGSVQVPDHVPDTW